MTRHGTHKRMRVLKVLLTDPEFDQLGQLCRSTGRGTYSEVVRYALFESGLGQRPEQDPELSRTGSGRPR